MPAIGNLCLSRFRSLESLGGNWEGMFRRRAAPPPSGPLPSLTGLACRMHTPPPHIRRAARILARVRLLMYYLGLQVGGLMGSPWKGGCGGWGVGCEQRIPLRDPQARSSMRRGSGKHSSSATGRCCTTLRDDERAGLPGTGTRPASHTNLS